MIGSLPRLSTTERMIVELLASHEELFGLQMVQLSEGRLKRGTVYVTLGRMQEKGYLESRQEPLPEGAIGLPRVCIVRPDSRCECLRRGRPQSRSTSRA